MNTISQLQRQNLIVFIRHTIIYGITISLILSVIIGGMYWAVAWRHWQTKKGKMYTNFDSAPFVWLVNNDIVISTKHQGRGTPIMAALQLNTGIIYKTWIAGVPLYSVQILTGVYAPYTQHSIAGGFGLGEDPARVVLNGTPPKDRIIIPRIFNKYIATYLRTFPSYSHWHAVDADGKERVFINWYHPFIVFTYIYTLIFVGCMIWYYVYGRRVIKAMRCNVFRNGVCWKCGYDVLSLQQCPECGCQNHE